MTIQLLEQMARLFTHLETDRPIVFLLGAQITMTFLNSLTILQHMTDGSRRTSWIFERQCEELPPLCGWNFPDRLLSTPNFDYNTRLEMI